MKRLAVALAVAAILVGSCGDSSGRDPVTTIVLPGSADITASTPSPAAELVAGLPLRCDRWEIVAEPDRQEATCVQGEDAVLWVRLSAGSEAGIHAELATYAAEHPNEICEHYGGGPLLAGDGWWGFGRPTAVDIVARGMDVSVVPAVDCGRPLEATVAPFAEPAERSLGPGRLAGISSDGTAAYVLAPEPGGSDVGCEGAPVEYLWAVDIAAGRRTPLLGDGQRLAQGYVVTHRAGLAVLVSQCEGFVERITIFAAGPAGDLSGGVTLSSTFSAAVPIVTVETEGLALLVGVERSAGDVAVHQVLPDTGESRLLFDGPVRQVAREVGDRYVWSDGEGVYVVNPDGEVLASHAGTGFAMAPYGSALALARDGMLGTADLDGLFATLVEWPEAWLSDLSVSWQGDVAYLRHRPSGQRHLVVTSAAGVSIELASDALPPLHWTERRQVLYTRVVGGSLEVFVTDL